MPGDIYGTHIKPTYNALSYTWGRWKLNLQQQPLVEAIEINGVEWPIPRIDPKHFSRADFHRVIKAATGQALDQKRDSGVLEQNHVLEHIWLDVACIDQREDSLEMAAEIGRQSKIFKGAAEVFVWLSGQSAETINEWIYEYAIKAELLIEKDITAIQGLIGVLQLFRSEPWFSSLWALQEAFLRQDAFIVTKDASTVGENDYGKNPLRLKDLIMSFDSVRNHMIENPDLCDIDKSLELRGLFEGFGFSDFFQGSPLKLLAAAQHRHTQPDRQNDRVYAIMQVFDLRLGKSNPSANQAHLFSLDELEDELGAALLKKYPVMSQMHIHALPSAHAKGWRFSRRSIIPRLADKIDHGLERPSAAIENCANLGTAMSHGDLWGTFSGPTILFKNIQQLKTIRNPIRLGGLGYLLSTLYIALDTTDLLPSAMPAYVWNETQLELASWMVDSIPGLMVLLLGRYVRQDLIQPVQQIAEWKVRRTPEWDIGLLLIPIGEHDEPGYWHRVGICIWRPDSDFLPTDMSETLPGAVPDQGSLFWQHEQGFWG